MLKKYFFILLSVVFLVACNQEDNAPVKSAAELQERLTKLNDLNSDLDGKRTQLYSLVREFNANKPEQEQFNITSLDTLMGADEKALLNAMFREEKDISYEGLVKVILEKNNEIADLGAKIADLEAKLPKPYSVKKGDTHYTVVKDFLMTQHGLDKKQAREIAWRTSMSDDLLPGNQIWLVFADGIVGTYVTQGTATVPPMSVQIFAKRRLLEKAFEEGRKQGQAESDSMNTSAVAPAQASTIGSL